MYDYNYELQSTRYVRNGLPYACPPFRRVRRNAYVRRIDIGDDSLGVPRRRRRRAMEKQYFLLSIFIHSPVRSSVYRCGARPGIHRPITDRCPVADWKSTRWPKISSVIQDRRAFGTSLVVPSARLSASTKLRIP